MRERLVGLGKRYARLATRAVVAHPRLWRVFRGPLRRQFDWLAPRWDAGRGPASVAILGASLDRLEPAPRRVLDLGTGTGVGARFLAERYPEAEVVGADLAPGMIAKARELLPLELAGRVRFEVADATALPFEDGSFDLIVLLNMIPFFGELARVASPGGAIVIAFGSGPETPIYVPAETLADRLEAAGFERVEPVEASGGTASIARRNSGPPGDPVLGTP
jgi:SAM-dependent methyltransferase